MALVKYWYSILCKKRGRWALRGADYQCTRLLSKARLQAGRDYGLTIPDFSMPEAFWVYELAPSYLPVGGMWIEMLPEFTQAEEYDTGYEAFHQQFLAEHGGLRSCPTTEFIK
jgi:hypothetical protein